MTNYMEEDLFELIRDKKEIILDVTAVYDSSLSGYHGELFLTLLSSGKDLLPYSMVMEPDFDFHGYRTHERICITGEEKKNAVRIHEPVSRSLRLKEKSLTEREIRLVYLASFLSEAAAKGYELMPVPKEILKDASGAGRELQSDMRNVIQGRIREVLDALSANKKISAGNIIGYGKGLTPSADDFCLGLLSTFEVSGKSMKTESLKEYIEEHKNKTTEVSYWMLEYALRQSKYPQILLEYYNGNPEDISLLENFLRHGSSSGVDILTGVLCGLHILNEEKGYDK